MYLSFPEAHITKTFLKSCITTVQIQYIHPTGDYIAMEKNKEDFFIPIWKSLHDIFR